MDPARFVLLDESGGRHGLAAALRPEPPRHARSRSHAHQHWQPGTFVPALRVDGLTTLGLLDGPMEGECFLAYRDQVFIPTLRPGDIVVMDDLGIHHADRVRERTEWAGATLRYLPPYSPDFDPVELWFAKVKALLRAARPPTVEELWATAADCLQLFPPAECRNPFIEVW